MRSPLRTIIVLAGVLSLVAVAAIGLLVADEGESAGSDAGVAIGDLLRAPERYAGSMVTVTGEASEAYPPERIPYAVVLGDETDDELLVVAQEPGVLPNDLDVGGLSAGPVVRATGRVLVVGRDRAVGPVVLPEDGLIERFAGKPALYATAVTVVDD
jgi:hypothetical protein